MILALLAFRDSGQKELDAEFNFEANMGMHVFDWTLLRQPFCKRMQAGLS